MLSRIPARIPGETQLAPEREARRPDAVGAVGRADGERSAGAARRQVDQVQLSRRGEERRLRPAPERPEVGADRGDAARRPPGDDRPGPPRAPAPVNDLQRRAAALDAYREVAAAGRGERAAALRADGAQGERAAALRGEGAQGERAAALRGDGAQGERAAALRGDGAQGERAAAQRAEAAREARVEAARDEAVERERDVESDRGVAERAREDVAERREPARLADPTYG